MNKFVMLHSGTRGDVLGFNLIEMSWEDIKEYARKEFDDYINNYDEGYEDYIDEFTYYEEHDGKKGIVMSLNEEECVYYLEDKEEIESSIREMDFDNEFLRKYVDYLHDLYEDRIVDLESAI